MRITEKKENGFYELKEGQEIYGEENGIRLVQIVGKYEDIKEELGINLLTLIEALKQDNIWVKEHNTKEQEIVYERIRLNFLNRTLDFVYPRKEIGKGRNLFDYGKTWALTKEELE